MQDIGVISEKINTLYELAAKEIILFDELEPIFLRDLQTFVVGQTLPLYRGKPAINHRTYNQWLRKLRIHGFDYALNFSE